MSEEVQQIKDKIDVEDVAEYDIKINNLLNSTEEFTIRKAQYPFWDMYTKPLQNPITLVVPPKDSAALRLYVDPQYVTNVDTYTLEPMVVLDRTGEEQRAPITVGIKSASSLIEGYRPTVLAIVSISPDSVDPRNEMTIRISLNNQNMLDYPNITVKVNSRLINDEIIEKLEPKGDKTIELKKNFDPDTMPQEDKLVVSVYRADRLIVNPIVTTFRVVEYKVEGVLPTQQSFLRKSYGREVYSNNPDFQEKIRIETSFFKRLFSSTAPQAKVVDELGRKYFEWDVKVNPSTRKFQAQVTENYRLLFVLAILAIIAVILYFLFRSPLVVRKSTASVTSREGGISEVKVVVRVKNRSRGLLTGIEVMDSAPQIADVHKEIEVGSIQPHAILKHPKRGLLIRWNLEKLEPAEEMVLSYRMKSRLTILGEFNLQAASARAKAGNKMVIATSNRVVVSG